MSNQPTHLGGHGRPLLLVHGLMGRGTTWTRQLDWLTEFGAVYGYDAPWHRGRDAARPARISTEVFVDELPHRRRREQSVSRQPTFGQLVLQEIAQIEKAGTSGRAYAYRQFAGAKFPQGVQRGAGHTFPENRRHVEDGPGAGIFFQK